MREIVLHLVISRRDLRIPTDQADNRASGNDVENFHGRIVKAIKPCQQVSVAGQRHNKIELLSTKANALGVASSVESSKEDGDGKKVTHVTA